MGLLDRIARALKPVGKQPLGGHQTRAVESEWSANGDLDTAFVAALGRMHAHLTLGTKDSGSALAELTSIAQRSGQKMKLAVVHGMRANAALVRGDRDEAYSAYKDALRIAREVQNGRLIADCLIGMGQIEADRGEASKAERSLKEAAERYQADGWRQGEFQSFACLAGIVDELAQQTSYLHKAAAAARAESIRSLEALRVAAQLAQNLVKMEEFAAAEDAAMKAIDLAEALEQLQLVAVLRSNLGALLAPSNPRAAREHLEKALQLSRRLGDKEGVRIAEHNISRLTFSSQTPAASPKAREPQQGEALRIVDELVRVVRHGGSSERLPRLRPGDPGLAEAVINLVIDRSDALEEQDKQSAFGLCAAALSVVHESAPASPHVRLLMRVANWYLHANQTRMAAAMFQQATEIATGAGLGAERVAAATNLAIVLRQSGEGAKALQVYEGVLATLPAGTEPPLEAAVLVNAGASYSDFSLHGKAVAALERGIELLGGRDARGRATLIARMNLACSRLALGELPRAEDEFQHVLDICRNEDSRPQEGVALGHLGHIRLRRGEIGAAIDLFSQAAQIAESTNDLWNAQNWYHDLANLFAHIHAETEARAAYEKTIAVSAVVGDQRRGGAAEIGLASLLTLTAPEEAEERLVSVFEKQKALGNLPLSFEAAIKLCQACCAVAAGTGHQMKVLSAGELPDVDARHIDVPALERAERWLATSRELVNEIRTPESMRAVRSQEANLFILKGDAARASEILESALDEGDPSAIGHLLKLAQWQRRTPGHLAEAARTLRRALALQETFLSASNASSHQALLLSSRGQGHIQLVEVLLAMGEVAEAFEACESAKNYEARRVLGIRTDSTHSALSLPTLEEMLRLCADTAVIELLATADQTFAFVVTAEGTSVVTLPIGSVAMGARHWVQLARSLEFLASPFASRADTQGDDLRARLDELAQELGSSLMAPIDRVLRKTGISRTVLIPYGVLHSFPLHALPIDGNRAWLDSYVTTYSPSATFLRNAKSTVAAGAFFSFADPLGDLPLARLEVRAAHRSLAGGAVGFAGADAGRPQLLHALDSADWIHFACHATFRLGNSYASGLQLARNEEPEFISLAEIFRDARLPRESVVVLSACETGTVAPAPFSDEYQSIAGSFLVAGARAVVASYWKVRDTVCALIMDSFYKQVLDAGVPLSLALHRAQVALRSMNEAEAHDALDTLMVEADSVSADTKRAILSRYSKRRTEVRPFSGFTDWAGFQLIQRDLEQLRE